MGIKIPFLDLSIHDQHSRKELLKAIDSVLCHGRFILGPEVERFEMEIAKSCKRKYGVGVNSGTDALFLALKCIDAGSDDEIITSSLSWIATANAISMTGAKPVFADVNNDLNINPASVEKLITPKTKAIMPVHFTGKICNMDKLMKIASENKIYLIEDACQAFGATYNGKKAGAFGDLSCFSMNPMKILAACGEAGIILTDSESYRNKLFSLRYNGTINKEECVYISLNARIDTLQAAILLKRLPHLKSIISKRRKIAEMYHEKLKNIVDVPMANTINQDIFYTYTIRAKQRDKLKLYLEDKGIETKIQHPILMPEQPIYKKNAVGHFKNAKKIIKQILCLPAHEKIKESEVEYIAESILEFYK